MIKSERISLFVVFLIISLLILFWWNITPSGIEGKIYAIGASVCHQIPSHSFTIEDVQFPLCSRCTGMYLGAFIGFLYLYKKRNNIGVPPTPVLVVLVLFIVGWSVDGANSFLGELKGNNFLYEPSNTLRLCAGFGMGLVISIATKLIWNMTIWKGGAIHQPIIDLKGMGLLIILSGLVVFSILLNNPLVMLGYAHIASITILVLITTLYTVVWTLILRRENQANKLSDLLLQIGLGILSAVTQITMLNQIKLFLYGNWPNYGL